jgi:serine/threonine protein kinase
VTGKFPFEGKLLELMEQICHESIKLPSHLHDQRHLFDLLKRMLHKGVEQRATVAEVLSHVWLSQEPEQQLALNDRCAGIGSVYLGLLPRSVINCLLEATLSDLIKGVWMAVKCVYDTCKNESTFELDIVRPKPRTRYEDVYRSMSITPYLHQLHYPAFESQNQVEISEDELDEFEQLRRIALIRSNRKRRYKRAYKQKHKLYAKFCHIMGFGKNQLDT